MGSPHTMDASVYRFGDPNLQEQCSGLECVVADALNAHVVAIATITLTLLLFVAVTYLRGAHEDCTEERSRIHDERNALKEFGRQVEGLQVSSMQSGGAARGGATLAQSNVVETQSQLSAVRSAYEDTIMSVPHYEEDYGEPLAANMAAELGEDVTVAVHDGERLTPQVKRALVQKSDDARKERASFLRTLGKEAEWLEDAEETFTDIDAQVADIRDDRRLQQSFSDLQRDWHTLDELETECTDVLERRQRHLDHGAAGSHWRDDWHRLCSYLYELRPVTYPILADGTLLLDRIQTTKRRVADSLTRRV